MPKGYHHLTYELRCQISALLQSGLSRAEIGRQLGVNRSTIKREIDRNSGKRGYRYKQSQRQASESRSMASGKPRKMTPALIRFIERRLRVDQWSPEQISGRMKQQKGVSVSASCIYQYVWKDRKNSGNLYLQLRHAGKKYNKRLGKTSGRGLIPDRVDIDKRPAIVDRKSRIGDWEADTIIGAKQKGVILSHVERKSKFTKLAKLPDKTSNSVVKACARVLLPLADQIKTITYDNGKEFAAHKKISKTLKSLSFFAKPYHSWERGLNEHTNGLVRQYFPKASDLSILSHADIRKVEKKLNDRPRKVLKYKTPSEVFLIS